jgi:N-acyl-D-aspartate/D-glutamate deacylase
MTSFPAARLGLFDRGVLKEGLWADLVIFDPAKIQDRATFEDPHQYPLGITHVLVNGRVAVENGGQSPHRNGRILRSGPA